MKPVPIEWARAIGQRKRYCRVAILYTDGHQIGITTYGQTRAECRALARWSESLSGTAAVMSMMEAPIQKEGVS